MSRLYLEAASDTRKTTVTSKGHQNIRGHILYGSKDKLKKVIYFDVRWPDNEDVPTVYVDFGKDIVVKQGEDIIVE